MTRRVLAAILLVAALAVTGFAIPLGAVIHRLYERDALLRLEREATAATIEVPASVRAGTRPDIPERLRDGARFSLYLPSGHRVYGQGPKRSRAVERAARSGLVIDGSRAGRLYVAVPVTSREHVVAVMWADRSLAAVQHRTREAWAAMVLLATVVLLVAAVLALTLARRLVRPVHDLSIAASRLGDGDFATRAGRSGIDEIDLVASALDTTAERLGSVLERERAFSADASHQLRTPLTAVRLHLAAAAEAADDDTRRSIDDAFADVQRLERTVDDLLRLARDADEVADLDLGEILREIDRGWRELLEREGRTLVIVAPPVPPPLRASAAALNQVLDVLLSNAERHGRGRVTVSVREIAGGLAIEIADEGTAHLDPDTCFTRRSHGAAGHGIGLALARSLTEAEGGRLLLRTDAPTTTFAILFPLDA